MKGIIAMDLDGTVVVSGQPIPTEITTYFEHLVRSGWKLMFITGRMFERAQLILKSLQFPYALAVQNGALVVEMPEHKVLFKHYLDASMIPEMEKICENEPTGVVVCGGIERDDHYFYRPHHFHPELLAYLKQRTQAYQEIWCEVECFSEVGLSTFPAIKCFGEEHSLKRIVAKIQEAYGLHFPVIRDPFNEHVFLAQGTHRGVDKGVALKEYARLFPGLPTIAAGDDWNDEPMIAAADIKIVMETAPYQLIERANIVAPAASKMGIIHGIDRMLEWI